MSDTEVQALWERYILLEHAMRTVGRTEAAARIAVEHAQARRMIQRNLWEFRSRGYPLKQVYILD